MALRFKADAVGRGVDLWHSEDLLDLVWHLALGDVHRLAAEAARLREALGNEIAHDDHGRAQELRRVRTGQAHRPAAGDVDGGTGADTRRVGAVEPGREDVREHGQVEDLLHRLVLVRELQQVPVGVGDHDVLSLATNPAPHVDVAVCGTRALGVHIEADSGLALLAVAAPATGDVEGHRAEVALFDELDVAADLDHLAGDLVAQHQALRGRGATTDHVLVRAADVCRDDPKDDTVVTFATHILGVDARTVFKHQLRIVDGLDFDFAGADIGDRLVTRHEEGTSSPARAATPGQRVRDARPDDAANRPDFYHSGHSAAAMRYTACRSPARQPATLRRALSRDFHATAGG